MEVVIWFTQVIIIILLAWATKSHFSEFLSEKWFTSHNLVAGKLKSRWNNLFWNLFVNICSWHNYDLCSNSAKHQLYSTPLICKSCPFHALSHSRTCWVGKDQKREISLFASCQRERFYAKPIFAGQGSDPLLWTLASEDVRNHSATLISSINIHILAEILKMMRYSFLIMA